MEDRSGLKLVGFIFATVTVAVMLTTTMVVKGYADGVYTLDAAPIESSPIRSGYHAANPVSAPLTMGAESVV